MSKNTWIEGHVPSEIVDSKIFKFEVTLPSVFQSKCDSCGTIHSNIVDICQKCSSTSLKSINKTIVVDIVADVDIDYDVVENELSDIPSQFMFWSGVYAEVKLRANYLERVVKSVRGTVYKELIEAQKAEKVKISQEVLKNIVEEDRRIVKAECELHHANMQSSKLYYVVEALRIKADLARTLVSWKREELHRS